MTAGRAPAIRFLARCKVYGQRATTYLNLVSQALVLRLFLLSQGVTSWELFLLILACVTTALLILMYLEDRAGLFEAETELQWSRSPQLRKIIEKMESK